MKVFELAKQSGQDSKTVLDALKELGVAVKTPVSVIPETDLEKAKLRFPAVITRKVVDVVLPPPEKKEEAPVVEKLKVRNIVSVPAEGMDPEFNQYAMGIRRQIVDGRKTASLLTFVFNPRTLEVRLLKEEPKRTEYEAILDLKTELGKRKVV